MSQSARNDPEGYLRREGEHKPYEPVKASTPKPEATAGDRELARQIFEVSETTDPFSEAHLVKLIAAHVAQRVAEAVAAEKGRRRMEAESYAARAGNDSAPVDGEFVAELMECQNDKEFTRCATRFRLKIERSNAALEAENRALRGRV